MANVLAIERRSRCNFSFERGNFGFRAQMAGIGYTEVTSDDVINSSGFTLTKFKLDDVNSINVVQLNQCAYLCTLYTLVDAVLNRTVCLFVFLQSNRTKAHDDCSLSVHLIKLLMSSLDFFLN